MTLSQLIAKLIDLEIDHGEAEVVVEFEGGYPKVVGAIVTEHGIEIEY